MMGINDSDEWCDDDDDNDENEYDDVFVCPLLLLSIINI